VLLAMCACSPLRGRLAKEVGCCRAHRIPKHSCKSCGTRRPSECMVCDFKTALAHRQWSLAAAAYTWKLARLCTTTAVPLSSVPQASSALTSRSMQPCGRVSSEITGTLAGVTAGPSVHTGVSRFTTALLLAIERSMVVPCGLATKPSFKCVQACLIPTRPTRQQDVAVLYSLTATHLLLWATKRAFWRTRRLPVAASFCQPELPQVTCCIVAAPRT
jgi:hypothetical protein